MSKIAVLISGSGTNLQALIDAQNNFAGEIALVMSNKADAFGLTRAQEADIETAIISHKDFDSRENFDRAMHDVLQQNKIDVIILAGFMRILTPWFVNQWKGRMLNIHPSLLPKFKGINAAEQALESGDKVTGCTVHVVTPELDDGPTIMQAEVEILPDDDIASLTKRIQKAEHVLYPKAVEQFLKDI